MVCVGGESATGAHWGDPASGSVAVPGCKACRSECTSCADADSCIECKDKTKAFSPSEKVCVSNRAKSCKQLLDWGLLKESVPKAGVAGYVNSRVTLWPDAEKGDETVTGWCHVVRPTSNAGDAELLAFTSIECYELVPGESETGRCKTLALVTDENDTCTAVGYIAGPPRSQLHVDAVREIWGTKPWNPGVPGISRKKLDGEKNNYGSCMMRDPNTYGRNGLVESCPDWSAVDGGAWWLMDTPMYDPNGDYAANSMLYLRKYVSADACVDSAEEPVFCAAQYAATEYSSNPCSDSCDDNVPHAFPCVDTSKSNAERGCKSDFRCDCAGFGESEGKAVGHWTRQMERFHKERDTCSVACPGMKVADGGEPPANTYYLCSTSDY